MTTAPNLLADLPVELSEEHVDLLLAAPGMRVERIISHGHASPEDSWYDQDLGEWVLLLSGAARVRFDGEEPVELRPGSYLDIPAHRRHRVEWTHPEQPTVWLAIHYA